MYVGISSSYGPEETARASAILKKMGMHLLIHQPRYSMLARQPEDGLLDTLEQEGMGCIAFSPLRNGILTDRYLHGIPADSRAAHDPRYLKPELLTEELLDRVRHLNDIAQCRGQSLAQMALSWVLRKPQVTSVLIGASKPEQIVENCQIVSAPPFTKEELDQIDALTAEK